jgi:D-alanyl-D-alanine carboxypeptidase
MLKKSDVKFPCLRLATLLLAAAVVASVLSCQGNTDAVKLFSPEKVAELDALLARAMAGTHAPGALVGIWKEDGTVLVKAYGMADTVTKQAMRECLSFRAGSITKTFTAHLVLQLVDTGKLSLDDPVSRFVESIPDGNSITVRMLLGHTSGLSGYGENPAFAAAFEREPRRVWAPRELVDAGVSNPPYFPPGEGCKYSNTNYILLGIIVERVTGRTFEEELTDRITGPLGLRHTTMAKGAGLTGKYMHGHMYYGDGSGPEDLTEYADASVYWTAGAMVSTVDDLRAWGRALATGQLLSPDLREAMTTAMHELPGMNEFFGYPLLYGLGIMDNGGWLGHSGMPIGYSSAMFYLPKQEAVMVVLFNLSSAEEPGMRLFMKAAKIFFPEDVPW